MRDKSEWPQYDIPVKDERFSKLLASWLTAMLLAMRSWLDRF